MRKQKKSCNNNRLRVNQMKIFTQQQQLEDGRRSGRVGVICRQFDDYGNEANHLQRYQGVFEPNPGRDKHSILIDNADEQRHGENGQQS